MQEFRKHLARNLRFQRHTRRLTQEELARLAGVGRSTVSRLERGEGDAKPSTLRRLARVLKIQTEELTGAPVQREVFPSTAERRLELVRAILALGNADLERLHPRVMDLLALADDEEFS